MTDKTSRIKVSTEIYISDSAAKHLAIAAVIIVIVVVVTVGIDAFR